MKDISTNQNGYRVSFSYTHTPSASHSINTSQKPRLPFVELGGKKDTSHANTIHQPGFYTHRYVHSEEQTVKKQEKGVQVIGVRTSTQKKVGKIMAIEERLRGLDEQAYQVTLPPDETSILKEQIKFLRKRLIEVESSEKAHKLELELYKAVKQVKSESANQQLCYQGQSLQSNTKEMAGIREQLSQQLNKTKQLELALSEERRQRQLAYHKNKGLNDTLIGQKQHISELEQKISELKQAVISSQNLQKRFQWGSQNQLTHRAYAIELQRKSQQNERLNNLFQSQKNAKLFLQSQLKAKLLENNSLLVKVDHLNHQLQQRHKDIAFLNQQSYNLDMSLNNAIQQLNHLKVANLQNSRTQQAQAHMNSAREQLKIMVIKMLQLQGEIERKAAIIASLHSKYEQILHRVGQQAFLIDQFKQKSQQLDQQRQKVQAQKAVQDQSTITSLAHIQDDLFFVKAQNQQLKREKGKLQDSQRALMHQIQWIIKEKDQTIAKLESKYKEQSNVLFLSIQQLKDDNKPLKGNASGHNQSQLNARLLQLEQKYSISSQQNAKLLGILDNTKKQLQQTTKMQEGALHQQRQKYQKLIQQINGQNNIQLNFYIEEIERLIQQMDRLKSSNKYYSNEVIEQESEDDAEVDTEKVKKDLIMHGQDASDFYVSPPSHTAPRPPGQTQTGSNYMLEDIIDLDQRINSYLVNSNKKKTQQ